MATSTLATTPTEDVEHDPLMLYLPVAQQVNPKKIPWTISYQKITPVQAEAMLNAADEYEEFGQRPRTKARKERWLKLMQSSRFVEYFPGAPLCRNGDGIIMNGGNRLAALADHDRSLGFMVIDDCPNWLRNYFDNGNMRTLRESMFINKRKTSSTIQATIRLGMRYEEFLFGKRGELGWAEWSRVKDEHVDIDNFMDKREYLIDFEKRGEKLKRRTGLQPASLICFIAYQQLAWPDGSAKLEDFLEGLELGAMLDKGHPALTLREWGNNDGYIGGYTHGRREGHLLLLFKFFALHMENVKVKDVRVAKGLPMAMPYHPKGWDVACQNVREALLEMG